MERAGTSDNGFVTTLKRNRWPILLTTFSTLGILLFLYLFYMRPITTIGPEQPIPFSHRVHAGVKAIQCQFCHPYVERSRFPGIPPVEKCLYCHNYVITQHPWIQKEHSYFDKRIPTPWVKVSYVPEFTFFNHQRHIRKKVECQECHGQVETMDRLKENRFLMGFCINCHKEKKANVDCWLACHN
jgi:hypothetical protein